jgi:hypothetical protein
MKRANHITAHAAVARTGLSTTPGPDRLPVELIFAGPRPASMRRGLEPAFLLFDRELLERLHVAAAALGVRYDALARRIAREHIEEY